MLGRRMGIWLVQIHFECTQQVPLNKLLYYCNSLLKGGYFREVGFSLLEGKSLKMISWSRSML